MTETAVRDDASGVRSVERACALLQAIREHPAAGVTELSRLCDLHKSTASRLLTTLEGSGLIERGDDGAFDLAGWLHVRPLTIAGGTVAPIVVAPRTAPPTVVIGGERKPRAIRPQRIRTHYWRPSEAAWQPACMDAKERADWEDGNASVSVAHQVPNPCADCPLGYAAEMRSEGRCNGQPGAVEEDDEPAVTPEVKERTMSVDVQVNVTAPCEGCAHVAVCNRREAIADLDAADVALETLPAGLSVQLAASVECDAFMAVKKSRSGPAPLAIPTEGRRPGHRTWTEEQREAARQRMLGNRGGRPAEATA